MDRDHAIWTFSQNFTSEFRAAYSELEAQLNNAKTSPTPEVIQSLSMDLAKLSKSLADAAGSLPTYDQKLYETQISALEKRLDEIRTSAVAKPKFAFKRTAQATPSSAPPTVPSTSTPMPTGSSSPPSSNSSISLHSHSYLTIDSLNGPPPTSDLTISNLDHCILNLLPTDQSQLSISAIHLRNIANSVLLLPMVNGSALIHNLSHCVVVMGCHQFRMHTSAKVDVFLSIASNPIIENCRDIRFAAYPQILLQPEQSGQRIEGPLAVQDFSHIRNTPSPNWTHMDQPDMSRPWPQSPLSSISEIEASLQSILPE